MLHLNVLAQPNVMPGPAKAIAKLNVFNARPRVAHLVKPADAVKNFPADGPAPRPERKGFLAAALVRVMMKKILVLRYKIFLGRALSYEPKSAAVCGC